MVFTCDTSCILYVRYEEMGRDEYDHIGAGSWHVFRGNGDKKHARGRWKTDLHTGSSVVRSMAGRIGFLNAALTRAMSQRRNGPPE